MVELDNLIRTLNVIGTDSAPLARQDVGHLVVSGHHVLSHRKVPGLRIEADETSEGLVAHVQVSRETTIENPIHLCFGMLQKVQQRLRSARSHPSASRPRRRSRPWSKA